MTVDKRVHHRRGHLVVRYGLDCGFAVLWVGVNRGRGRPGSLGFRKGIQNLRGTDVRTRRLAGVSEVSAKREHNPLARARGSDLGGGRRALVRGRR